MDAAGWARRRRDRRAQWTATPPVRDGFLIALDDRRRRLRLAHKDFAGTLGVSRSTWSKVWNGRRPPSRYLVERALAKYPALSGAYASVARARVADATPAGDPP